MDTTEGYVPTGIDQRETGLRPLRPGHHTIPEDDTENHLLWDDGRQTYTLQWGQGAYGSEHGARIADLADTLIMAVEAIRHDRHKLTDQEFIASSLTGVRRLRSALAAVEDELLKASRESGMSLRYTAAAMDVHHTTVDARITRLAAGERADWFGWLMQPNNANPGL
jgi:hypothetical protein